jgi:hypothetical protein
MLYTWPAMPLRQHAMMVDTQEQQQAEAAHNY